jgi:hypothetical protein
MPQFIIAIFIVFGGLWLIRKMGRMPKKAVPAFLQKSAGYALMAFSGLLALRGSMQLALPVFMFGMGLAGKAAMFPNGINWGQAKPESQNQSAVRTDVGMTRQEALSILGLDDTATAQHIKEAHKRLLKDFHPDKGGSDYLAAKINAAKDFLLS